MIIATAGHIDHGKTALVKALTGVDADRLPEEKARGITVDLGFAYQRDTHGGSLGFVDVPGHEKLVRTMVAGATGVDFVMLVVAADDGVMPQTREHLAIIDLLGITRGVAVITKTDTVDVARIAQVTAEIEELLAGSGLFGSPVLAVSALRGDGIGALQTVLAAASGKTPQRKGGDGFRLAIDRAFTLTGAGLIVAGTVHAGRVAVGERLLLAPRGREIRVRGIHAQNEKAEAGNAGQRCALNITGARIDKTGIERGDWIIAPRLSAPTGRFDARLRLLPSAARTLRHWTPVHVHIGASDLPGRVGLLEASTLEPGKSALAQILLDRPTSALAGDRFVIRDQSARVTLGGGHVIDPLPPPRNARKPERLAWLRAFDQRDDAAALDVLLEIASLGVDLDHFALARNIDAARLAMLVAGRDVVRVRVAERSMLFARTRWSGLRDDVLAALLAYQEKYPESFGATSAELLRGFAPAERQSATAALDALVTEKAVIRFGQVLQLPGHTVKLSTAEENLWFEMEQRLLAHDLDPPRLALLADGLRLTEDELRPLLEKLARMGRLRRVSKTYFVLPEVLSRLADAAQSCAQAHPQAILTVGNFRDTTRIGRNAVMPVLEFFDRVGFTSRIQEGRRLRPSGVAIFSEIAAPR